MTTETRDTSLDGTPAPKRKTASDVVKTYRYLRIALVLLLAGIAVAVAVEFAQVGARCLQGSISAYYYTPVRAFFVSAVLALGVGLVALRGAGFWEETWLNFAGMLAPVVALVPTPDIGNCTSDPTLTTPAPEAVANNITALFWMAPIGLVYVLVLRWLAKRRRKRLDRPQWLLLVPAGLLWAIGVGFFLGDRDGFIRYGHGASAIAMFVCIVGVVAANGLSLRRKERAEGKRGPLTWANRYLVIAYAMVLSFVVILVVQAFVEWDHWVFALEATLLGLFLVFWTLQTEELWDEVVREGDPAVGTARSDGRLVSPFAARSSTRAR